MVRQGEIIIWRSGISRDDGAVEIVDAHLDEPVPHIQRRPRGFPGMADRHQRLDLEAVPLRDPHRARVVFQRGALLNVLQNSRIGGLEAAQQPAKTCAVHCRRLRVGEQLRLHEAAQPEFHGKARLQVSDRIHQLQHRFADVELIVIKHEAGVAVGAMD